MMFRHQLLVAFGVFLLFIIEGSAQFSRRGRFNFRNFNRRGHNSGNNNCKKLFLNELHNTSATSTGKDNSSCLIQINVFNQCAQENNITITAQALGLTCQSPSTKQTTSTISPDVEVVTGFDIDVGLFGNDKLLMAVKTANSVGRTNQWGQGGRGRGGGGGRGGDGGGGRRFDETSGEELENGSDQYGWDYNGGDYGRHRWGFNRGRHGSRGGHGGHGSRVGHGGYGRHGRHGGHIGFGGNRDDDGNKSEEKLNRKIIKHFLSSVDQSKKSAMMSCSLQKLGIIDDNLNVNTTVIISAVDRALNSHPEDLTIVKNNLSNCTIPGDFDMKTYVNCLLNGCSV